MSYYSQSEIDETPNASLFVDPAYQQSYTLDQYVQKGNLGLNAGCKDMDHCQPSCAPMFYCPNKVCPPLYVHAGNGECMPANYGSNLVPAVELPHRHSA